MGARLGYISTFLQRLLFECLSTREKGPPQRVCSSDNVIKTTPLFGTVTFCNEFQFDVGWLVGSFNIYLWDVFSGTNDINLTLTNYN